MATVTIIPKAIKASETHANIDFKYGPYEATSNKTAFEVADETLGGGVTDLRTPGLTIGIVLEDGSIKEYWYQPNPQNASSVILVEKVETFEKIQDSEINTIINSPA